MNKISLKFYTVIVWQKNPDFQAKHVAVNFDATKKPAKYYPIVCP
jgi:hypothetical protein